MQVSESGYSVFATKIGGRSGKCFCFRVHKLVAETYIPNPYNKPEVNHIDGNKLNNHVSNLEWVTHRENMGHAYTTGLIDLNNRRGINHKRSKLSECEIKEIRDSKETSRVLSKKYGVDHTTISKIKRRASYKNV